MVLIGVLGLIGLQCHANPSSTPFLLSPSDTLQIQEVVITNGIEKELQRKTSLNTHFISEAELRAHRGGSLMHSLAQLPGIDLIPIGSGQSKPLIRGLGFDRVVVVDQGIKHEAQQWGLDHGLEIDQFFVSRLEVVKGPASYRYGSNAIGGVLNILPEVTPAVHTRGGTVEWFTRSNNQTIGTAWSGVQRWHHLFLRGHFSFQRYGDYRVPTDTVHVYNAPVKLKDGSVRNTAGQQLGAQIQFGILREPFQTTSTLSYWFSQSGFFANAHGLEPRQVDEVEYDKSSRDIQFPSDKVTHLKWIQRASYTIQDHFLELQAGIQVNDRKEFSPYIPHGFMPSELPLNLGLDPLVERAYHKLVGSLSLFDSFSWRNHQFQLGAQAEYQRNRIAGYGFLTPAFTQHSLGAFIYDAWRFTTALQLHATLRMDAVGLNISNYSDWFETPDYGYLARVTAMEKYYKSLSGGLGLHYFHDQISLKINVGSSFRTPSAKELAANGVNYHYFSFEKGNPSLKPETSYQLDIAVSQQLDGWQTQVSPFLQYFPNYIYLNPTAAHDEAYGAGNQVFEYTQAEVLRFGGEFVLSKTWNSRLSNEVSLSYVYAMQRSGVKKGFSLPFSPPASVLLQSTYSPPAWKGWNSNRLSLDLEGVAKQNRIVPPEKITPSYLLIHLSAGTQKEVLGHSCAFQFQVNNLLNTRYLKHTSFYRLIDLPEPGINVAFNFKIHF